MPFDWFVDVHAVEEGHVEAGEPHVYNDGDFEVGFGCFKLFV